jgi:RNA polymerase sigma factor (sigma-70 family)
MAEDVTQVVFIILAKKAHKLEKGTVLAGWLHRTTHYISIKALVKECRRRQREEKAVQMQTADNESSWESLAPVLDDALAQLGESERGAILMRYFQNRSFREVGAALGISDDTAQKKVSRSLDKLRRFLFRRGVAISVASFTGLTATRAAQFAPETLAGRVLPAALKGTDVSTSVYALLEDSIRPTLTLKAVALGAMATTFGLAIAIWTATAFSRPAIPSSRRLVQSPVPSQAARQARQERPTSPTPTPTSKAPTPALQPAPAKPPPPTPVQKPTIARPVVPKTNTAPAVVTQPVLPKTNVASPANDPQPVSNPSPIESAASASDTTSFVPSNDRSDAAAFPSLQSARVNSYGVEVHRPGTSAPPQRVQIPAQPRTRNSGAKKRLQ